MFKKVLKNTRFGQWFRIRIQQGRWVKQMANWERNGRKGEPPHPFKVSVVQKYARRFSLDVLIETGTYLGDMVDACRYCFSEIHSIELGDELAKNARRRFSHFPNITIHQGSSPNILPAILSSLDRPALFWLDAHYSGGNTARGSLDTPIINELRAIFTHSFKDHVLLIDDARCFVGQNDYPTIQELKEFVLSHRPDFVFEVEYDIIIIHPALPMDMQ